jgi:pyrimidine-nucleoside phosphorylase
MLLLGRRARDLADGRRLAEAALADGTALEKFRVLVEAQGGDVSYVDSPGQLPRADLIETVTTPAPGWLAAVDARAIGEASVALGAGRASKSDLVDHAVGFEIHHKVGDRVEQGESLFTVHANDAQKFSDARERVLNAHRIANSPAAPLPLFYE